MATTIQGGISFRNIFKDSGVNHADTIIQKTFNANSAYPSDSNFALVNTVDIDWDDAWLPNSGSNGTGQAVNTSGDVLKLIDDMQKEIYVLTAAVIALAQK